MTQAKTKLEALAAGEQQTELADVAAALLLIAGKLDRIAEAVESIQSEMEHWTAHRGRVTKDGQVVPYKDGLTVLVEQC